MTFLGISSSLAGAEPGRSGFPASYTSLLTVPLGCPAERGLFGPLSGRASVKSVPLPGDDRARIEMSARVPSAAALNRRRAGFPVPAAPHNAERTGEVMPTRNEACAKRGGCDSAATTEYQAKGSIANLTGTSGNNQTPPKAIRVGLTVGVSQSATSEKMDVTAGRDRHPLSGLRRIGAVPSAVASAGVKMGVLQSPRQRPFEPGSRHRSRWSNDPAVLDLPKGALSPWGSASVTCPGVRTSSPAPGAFAGLPSTGEFDHDHRH